MYIFFTGGKLLIKLFVNVTEIYILIRNFVNFLLTALTVL